MRNQEAAGGTEQVTTFALGLLILLNIAVTAWFFLHPPAFILRIDEFISLEIWNSLSMKANRVFVLAGILASCIGAFFLARFKAQRYPEPRSTVSWIIDCLSPLGLLPLATLPLLYADAVAPFWRTNLPIFWILALLSLSLTKLLTPALDAPRPTSECGQRSDRLWAISIFFIATIAYAFGGHFFSHTVGEHVGDEGHYQIQAQSLYEDRDLDIKNQILASLNVSDLEQLDPERYHIADSSRGDAWYSWHPYGLSLFLAPVWPWETAGRQLVLGLISGLGLAGLFLLCRRVGAGKTASLLAVLALGTSIYWVVYSFRSLPEVLGGTLVIWTFWAIAQQQRSPWLTLCVAAACCVFMPFAQTRFIPLSLMGIGLYGLFGLLGQEQLRTKLVRLTTFTLCCVGGYVAYMVIQMSLFSGGSSYPIREVLFSYPLGAWAILASERGLISIFPALIWALGATAAWFFIDKRNRLLCLGMIATFAACLLTSATYPGYTGGGSVPGRYLVAVTPLLFVGVAVMLERADYLARTWFFFLSLFSTTILFLILVHLELVGRDFVLPIHRLSSFPLLQSLYFPHAGMSEDFDGHAALLTSIYVAVALLITWLILFRRQKNVISIAGLVIVAVLGIFTSINREVVSLNYYIYFHALPIENARSLELVDPLSRRPPFEADFDMFKFHGFTGERRGEQDVDAVSRIAREGIHAAGMMAFGRFRHVFPGTFTAYYDLRLGGGDVDLPVAGLDVATDDGKIVLAQADVGERPFSGVVQLPFEVRAFGHVEPRIYYYGLGQVDFRGMSLRETPPPGNLNLSPLAFQRVPIETIRSIFPSYLLHISAMSRSDDSRNYAPDQTNRNGEMFQ